METPAPFVLFGPSYLATLAVLVLACVVMPLWVRSRRSERLARRLAVAIAIFQVTHELFKAWVYVALYDLPLINQLPIQDLQPASVPDRGGVGVAQVRPL